MNSYWAVLPFLIFCLAYVTAIRAWVITILIALLLMFDILAAVIVTLGNHITLPPT